MEEMEREEKFSTAHNPTAHNRVTLALATHPLPLFSTSIVVFHASVLWASPAVLTAHVAAHPLHEMSTCLLAVASLFVGTWAWATSTFGVSLVNSSVKCPPRAPAALPRRLHSTQEQDRPRHPDASLNLGLRGCGSLSSRCADVGVSEALRLAVDCNLPCRS